MPDYLDAAVLNFISGTKYKYPSLDNLSIAFERQANVAVRQYENGRTSLQNYIEGINNSTHRIRDYLLAIESFEHCLSAVGRAIELEIESRKLLLPPKHHELLVFKKKDGSALSRIVDLNNLAKHWNVDQAAKDLSAPVWITNNGLSSETSRIDFSELRTSIIDLNDQCRWLFVELPAQARALHVQSSTSTNI